MKPQEWNKLENVLISYGPQTSDFDAAENAPDSGIKGLKKDIWELEELWTSCFPHSPHRDRLQSTAVWERCSSVWFHFPDLGSIR